MSGALGTPQVRNQVLSHADALRRIYAISLYAVDNLRLAQAQLAQSNPELALYANECMDCLGAMQTTIVLATPIVQHLGE